MGFKAWDDYIGKLGAMDAADDRTKSDALLGTAWIYESLASYRASAARYLREVARDFGASAAACMDHAAGLYEQIAGKVLSDEEHTPARIAPYPGGPDDGMRWTVEMRREQVRRLEAALMLERDAIGDLEGALRGLTGGPESKSSA